MTRFDELPSPQFAALCNVAFGGNGGGVSPQMLASLERRGLIAPVVRHVREGNLLFSITTWTVPLPFHIEFCAWCAEHPPLDRAALYRRTPFGGTTEAAPAPDHAGRDVTRADLVPTQREEMGRG